MTVLTDFFKKLKAEPLYAAVFILPFVFGGFFEFISCIVSAGLLVWLIFYSVRCKKIKISLGLSFFSLVCIALFYLISAFWAIDSGMATVGFLKFLPLPLFAMALMQTEPEKRNNALSAVPISGAIMTAVSFALSFIPALDSYVKVSERLAGFFEYPNTFALFLLLGLIIIATSEKLKPYSLILAVILIFGIFQSGSRTVFILLIISAAAIALFGKSRTVRKITLILIPSAIAVSLAAVFITGSFQTVGRFLTSSVSQSSFLGRLLYYKDALPVILTNPFGLGYDGYYYAQGSFQTGVYTVKFIHNDFLQLFLDVGWIPSLLFIAAVARSFFKKGVPLRSRLLILVICAHSMLDFSLQYLSIFFILIVLMDFDRIKELEVTKAAKKVTSFFCAALSAVSIWIGSALFLNYIGEHFAAASVYPLYTESYTALLAAEQDIAQAKAYADRIISLNKNVYQAYSLCGLYAYSQGDFKAVTENMEKAIELSPYTLESYTEYIEMLSVGIQLYRQAGDELSALYCVQRLLNIPSLLQSTKEKTSEIAWLINDTPQLELPEEYLEMIEAEASG